MTATRGARATTIAATALMVGGLAGCSDDDSTPSASATVTVTATVTSSVEPEPTASPTESPTASTTSVAPNVGDAALRVGEWREGTGIRSQVIEVRQAEASTRPSYLRDDSSSSGAVALVRTCARDTYTDNSTVSGFDWYGIGAGGSQYTTSGSSWDEWPPRPQYPLDNTTLRAGQCIKGWVLLSAPDGDKVTRVALGAGTDTVAEWIVD